MTDILTAAQRVRRYLEDMPEGFQYLPALDEAQYFEISAPIYDAAWNTANVLLDQEDPVIPVAAQLPASSCMLWHPDLGANSLVWAFSYDRDKEKYIIFKILSDHRDPITVGGYVPGSMELRANENLGEESRTRMAMSIFVGACLFELINEPRFVVREPVGTRQSRRAMKRQVPSFSPDGWSRIVWDLNKPVKGRDEFGSNRNFHMPLHFTRGYWRKAHAAAKTNVHVVRGERRQWVEGYWSGHPAYGIKKSVYAPTISGEK